MMELVKKEVNALGYREVRPQQMQVIKDFVSGNDVFVSLPTGFGKSLCYGALSLVFDMLKGNTSTAITVVISLLISIMKDQTAQFNLRGLKSAYISSDPGCTYIMKQEVIS